MSTPDSPVSPILGAEPADPQPVLTGSFGGESGPVIAALIAEEGVTIRSVVTAGDNGVYVHDRRSGERVVVASMPPVPLSRHDLDALYGSALVEGMEGDVCVLGGHVEADVAPAETYGRLAGDLSANGAVVIADLSGDDLDSVLDGGVSALKVSSEDLVAHGHAEADTTDALVPIVERMAASGAANVVVSRAEAPALGLLDGELVEVVAPGLQVVDHRGAGDSMTAGIAVGIARGDDLGAAVRLGAAAGALNITRRGPGTGHRDETRSRHPDDEQARCRKPL